MNDPGSPTVCQISVGRFHQFHLARQLQKRGWLEAIFTGYPGFKLRDETGIPAGKVRSFPWLQTPYMALNGRVPGALSIELARAARHTLDRYASRRLGNANVVMALSGCGLRSGEAMQSRGGVFVCDRGSSHIRYQDEILREEHRRWGLPFAGIDPRIIDREEAEYEAADVITVPSGFVEESFVAQGVPRRKLARVPYGVNLNRFHPVGAPDPSTFRVIYVGQVSVRKGFLDLLEAFGRLTHPRRELLVAGKVHPIMEDLLRQHSVPNVRYLGAVSNQSLNRLYSDAHICVLPSIEDGFGLVAAEAMACGCPVIASENAGAADLIGEHAGMVVPARRPEVMAERLEQIARDPSLRATLSAGALSAVARIAGWDHYGHGMAKVIASALSRKDAKASDTVRKS